jgi:nucleoside-diphosphate-sugar epimerase
MSDQHTIIVTGSSGLIGSAVIERLSSRFKVVGFDKVGPPHPPVQAECVSVDLTSDQSVEDAMARVRYAYGDHIASVIHLAAYYDFSGKDSPFYEELTVRGTERLLRNLRDFHVEQFIFSSTMLVHAPTTPGKPITEDSPLEAKWEYPQSKIDAERAILAQHDDTPVVLMRIAGVYDDDCHSLPLAHQIQRVYERRLTAKVYPGDITRGQAFVHLEDLLEAIDLAIARRRELPAEAIVLIGEPKTPGYDTLQREFARLIHGEEEEWETREIPKTLAEAGAWLQDVMPFGEEPFIKPWMIEMADDHYELDISRAHKLLGWTPRHSLQATLPAMVRSLKQDPAEFYLENKLEGEPPDIPVVVVTEAASLSSEKMKPKRELRT